MNHLNRRWIALAMALVIFLSPLPLRAAGAAGYQKLTALEELVSGQYVLLSSNGDAPGALREGWLVPLQPAVEEGTMVDALNALWTLTVTQEGILLSDPEGNAIAPGESQSGGLTVGEYAWTVTCREGVFSFHGTIEGQPVTLARCDDLGFRAFADSMDPALYDGSFSLYLMTEQIPPNDPTEDTTAPDEETTAPGEETTAPTEEPTDPTQPPTDPPQPEPAGPRLYFGQLHAHTVDSDGFGTPAQAYAAAAAAGMDFFAITDHSNSLDGADRAVISEDASTISQAWKLGREAAKAAASDTFLPIYGYEMTWQNGLGHISTFFTPGFQSREQADFSEFPTALENYYAALASVPGSVSQFNHPGSFYGDFEDFAHGTQEARQVMQLLEVCSEGIGSYDAYIRALDKGWRVAPTNNENNHEDNWGAGGRTVVYADALTGEAFASALNARRVYATEDGDLEILYRLDGQLLGSVLPRRQVGDTVTLTASLTDPTDPAIGQVEVIVDGGTVAASQTLDASSGELTFQLPSQYRYYCLRITQPDGDVAVTAPVWIQQSPAVEIRSFTTETALAISGRPISVTLQVENRDNLDLTVEEVGFFLGGQKIAAVYEPETVSGNGTAVCQAVLTCNAAGPAEIQAVVTGTLGGDRVECSATLPLTFLTEDLTTTIVADETFGTLPALTELEAVAAKHRMALVRCQNLTAQVLSSCDLLLIPAPQKPFPEEYGKLLADYLRSGRTLILTGRSDQNAPDASAWLNALLEKLDLTARFRDDTAFDPVNNGGQPTWLYTSNYAPSLAIGEPYCQTGGCTVDPGAGKWLVTGMATTFSTDGDGDGLGIGPETYTEVVEGMDVVHSLVAAQGEAVLLAKEDTAFGGSVFLAGGDFLGDDALDPGGDSIWESPNGNGLLLEEILNIPREPLALSTIAQAKAAEIGKTVRLQGFVTAGTAVPGNIFPEMIYLQDETGGLGVLGFTEPGISLGTPLQLYLLREEGGFRLLHYEKMKGMSYLHPPKKLDIQDIACDPYEDALVQTEGKIVALTPTEDGRGLSGLTLEDRQGNRVTVRIEEGIRSGSTGKNTLAETVKEEDWVSAAGIVYRVNGQAVLRVRNCDEITVIRETGKSYRVVKGAYSVWIRTEGKSLYMEVEGPGKELLGVNVDGTRIDQSHYQTTEEENLVFRFWPRYLKTLELGTHSVVFQFRDGEAKATLVVWSQADSPYTGDPVVLPLLGMALSGGLLPALSRKRKERG